MTMVCEGLELLAIPHLGIYDTQGYHIFPSDPIKDSISDLPKELISQLERLNHLNINLQSLTIHHNAEFLSNYSDFVDLNLIFQPYVFYDASFGNSHECTLNMAVYQDDCEYSKAHLNNRTCDSVAINPDDIFKCHLFTCVHPDKGFMCLSPNNGRIKVSTYVPMHVFYTLVLVPYKGKIVKGLISKHLLVVNRGKIYELGWIREASVDEDDVTSNFDILNRVDRHPGIIWYMHNILWKLCGRPLKNKFGENKWWEIQERYLDDEEVKKLFLSAIELFLNDLNCWLNICLSSLEDIKKV